MNEAAETIAPVVAVKRKSGRPSNASRLARPETVREARAVSPEARPERKHKRSEGQDVFYIPASMIPRGYTLEWKRVSILNKPEDDSYFVELAEQGWKAATPQQFPKLVTAENKSKSIIRKGMMLMIRPVELTKEARLEERAAAQEQVRDKLKSIGSADRGEFERNVNSLRRTYERPPVEEAE